MGSVIGKIIGCAVALMIAVGSVPVGLLYFATPIVAEGQFVKIMPINDTFVYSEAKNKNRFKLDEQYDLIGNYWNTYLKFDLSALGNAKKTDIGRAVLRLTVVQSGINPDGEADCSFNVSYLDNNNWNENMNWSGKPNGEEQYLCTASSKESNSVLDIDITEFMKKAVSLDDRVITLKLSPSISCNAPVKIASVNVDDPSLRPCLKIALSDAEDPDLNVLNKSYIDTCAYVSAAEPDTSGEELLERNNGYMAVDNGSAAYLKFNLEPRNILGTINDARILFRSAVKSANTKIDIYYLENNDWTAGDISYNNRPQGEAELIKSYNGIDTDSEFNIDVTDIIYNLIRKGEYTASFIIDGTATAPSSTDSVALYSGMSAGNAPSLAVSVTDNPEETAVMEALSNILGKNSAPDNITTDLPNSYTAENGVKVGIKWIADEAVSLPEILRLNKSTISQSGKINRPPYLENPKTVRIKAVLTAGSRTKERLMTLTVRPEFGVPNRLDPLKKVLE
ncbi:MAG: DNRLRE domain-containing protein [Clostridiales bacterium]|nr:DNRLRE domain-containing protein [Clostridiales bacterium]